MNAQLDLFDRASRLNEHHPRPRTCDAADELAVEGDHTIVAQRRGLWSVLTTRSASGDDGPAWALRCRDAARVERVRVYDRASICTWDSATPRVGYVLNGVR